MGSLRGMATMTRRSLIAGLALAALALGPPASALAQSAGDNQYQDPFGSKPKKHHKSTRHRGKHRHGAKSGRGHRPSKRV
jgi:hypothetical protein